MAEFSDRATKRIAAAVRTAERLAKLPRPRNRQLQPSGGGASAVLAVVTACQYDSVSLSLTVTCSRLLATDYDYDPDPADADKFVAWAGLDPLIVVDSIVLLISIIPMPGEPDITWVAVPMLSADRSTLDMPDMACLTAYTEPCAPQQVTEICLPG